MAPRRQVDPERLRQLDNRLSRLARAPWGAVVFSLALAGNIGLRLYFLRLFAAYPVQFGDDVGYLNIARHFGSWLVSGNAIRLPLYPLFLSLFVGLQLPEWTIFAVQHLLYLMSAWMLMATAFRAPRVRCSVYLLLIYYGPFVIYPDGMLTETFTVVLLMLLLTAWLRAGRRWGRYLLVAVLGGLIGLVRPNMLFLWPLMAGLLVITRRLSLTQLALGLALFALPVLAWVARNHAIQGAWVYNTTGGENLYYNLRIICPTSNGSADDSACLH